MPIYCLFPLHVRIRTGWSLAFVTQVKNSRTMWSLGGYRWLQLLFLNRAKTTGGCCRRRMDLYRA